MNPNVLPKVMLPLMVSLVTTAFSYTIILSNKYGSFEYYEGLALQWWDCCGLRTWNWPLAIWSCVHCMIVFLLCLHYRICFSNLWFISLSFISSICILITKIYITSITLLFFLLTSFGYIDTCPFIGLELFIQVSLSF